jgi:Uncharacterized protein conserved in bacteria
MAYNLHDIKVEGLELEQIIICSVEGAINEHSKLYLNALIKDEKSIIELKAGDKRICVYFDDKESGKHILFYGIVSDLNIWLENGLRILRVEAISYSYMLAYEKKSRSFQNISMKYSELVSLIVKDYENIKTIVEIPDKSIENIIVQYEETDWDFLKRILSEIGSCITPEITSDGISLYIGIPNKEAQNIPYQIINIKKDFKIYYYMKANQEFVQDVYYSSFFINSYEHCNIFENVYINEKIFTIYQYKYVFYGSELSCGYNLQHKEGLKQKRIYPMNIIGVALEGNIKAVNGDKVQIKLNIDNRHKNDSIYWFSFSTISASNDGSGWYCMPEVNDIVRLYFPSKYMNQAIALSAVSNYVVERGSEDKMQDPNVKFLSTKHNQALILAPDKVQLSCNGNAVLSLTTDGKVELIANETVNIIGEESVSVLAEEINIHASESVEILSLQGGTLNLTKTGDVVLLGTEVKVN